MFPLFQYLTECRRKFINILYLNNIYTRRNYKFSVQDSAEIIRWIEDNLEINFIAHSENLGKIEESLIVKYVPLLNLDKNPVKLSELVELRRKCKAVANGY